MSVDALWGNIFKDKKDSQDDLCDVLAEVPIFEGLSKSELRNIERIVHKRKFSKGEKIFKEGNPGLGMYIIRKGSIDILKELDGGGSLKIAHLEQGAFTGEFSLLNELPRSASAVACEDCEMIGFFRPDFLGLMDRNPRLGVKIAHKLGCFLTLRLHQSAEQLEKIRQKKKLQEIV